MSGPIDDAQDELFDPALYRHHLLLLKSAHCCRPVVHKGLNQFIHGLTLYRPGSCLAMTVYLAGKKEGVDSSEIEIRPASDFERNKS